VYHFTSLFYFARLSYHEVIRKNHRQGNSQYMDCLQLVTLHPVESLSLCDSFRRVYDMGKCGNRIFFFCLCLWLGTKI